MASMQDLDTIPFRLLLDRVVEPIRRHFSRFFLPTAVPLVAIGFLVAQSQNLLIGQGNEPPDLDSIFALSGRLFGLIVVVMVGYSLIYTALSVAAIDAVAGRTVSLTRAWRFTLRPSTLFTLLLTFGLLTLGFCCCLLPGLYFMPILALVLPVMVEEKRSGIAALRRAFELALFNPQGSWLAHPWLKLALVVFISWVVQYALTLPIQLPLLVIQQLMMFRHAAGGGDPSTVLAQLGPWNVVTQMVSALALATSWLYPAFLFPILCEDLKRRKEGHDLETAIDRLAN